MIIHSLDDVKSSRFLNKLDKVAESYGLQSCFADVSEPNCNGVYFFCGNMINSVLSDKTTLQKSISPSGYDGLFYTKCKAFVLTGQDDFITHQHIVIFMQNLEMLNTIYAQINLPVPSKLTNEKVFSIRNLYLNTISCPNEYKKKQYFNVLKDTLISLDKPITLTEEAYDHYFYDPGLTKLQNARRKKDKDLWYKVTLTKLTSLFSDVGTVVIRHEFKDAILKKLSDKKIFFNISETTGEKLDVPDNEGFGSAKANDTRKFILSYGKVQEDKILNIVDSVIFPELYSSHPKDLYGQYGNLLTFSIPTYEYDNFISLCKANNVPFSYNDERTSPKDINICVPKQFEYDLDAILERLSKEAETFKIIPKPSIPYLNQSKNTEQPKSMEIEYPNRRQLQFTPVNIQEEQSR